jgi:hypothetical protein
VAGIYIHSHEEVHASRVEWLAVRDGRVSLRWTGTVDDPDGYDAEARRQRLLVEVQATAIERPHESVAWTTINADQGESLWFRALQSAVVTQVAADLAARRWFEGMPFCALELAVQVEARGRRWPEWPPRGPADRQLILARLPRALAVANDAGAIRRAIEAEIAAGLDRLEKRFRQRPPTRLR